jgi:Spy/CpxP family protein refolding chaperone
MKSTKTLFLTALAVGGLLALGMAANAADTANTPPSTPPAGTPPPGLPPGGPGMRGQGGFDFIAKQLNLTDDQKPKVKAILEDQRKKMGELRQDTTLSNEDKMAKRKTIQDSTATQMKAILTAEQFEKWQAMQSKMRPHRPGGPPPGGENAGGTPPPATPPNN